MKIIHALFLLLILTSSRAHSAGSGEIDILRVEVTDRYFTVYSANENIGTEGCQDQGKVVFWRDDFTTGYDSMLSAGLAAHMVNKKITMWLNGCKAGPWGKTLPIAASIVIL